MSTALLEPHTAGPGPKPLTEGSQSPGILIALWAFVVIPFVALLVAVPMAWGGWLAWTDVIIGLVWYVVSGLGITVGFHRYFTHGSFKAKRWLRVAPGGRRFAGRRRARSSSGWPTTAATTRSPTWRATRTRRGASAPASGR